MSRPPVTHSSPNDSNNDTKGKTMNTSTQTPTATKSKSTNGAAQRAENTSIADVVNMPPRVDARATLQQIRRELNATFAEREREIDGLIIALVAGEHVLLLGPAGTAKSALANTLCQAIDGATFYAYLLTRFSTPEEIYGPVSLEGLKQDRFRRVTQGKLPEAHIGFLDECYKANSAVLNSLLTAINERKFDNDGQRISIPLLTLVGASNELPEGPELAALHDRFMLRYWTTYTKTPDAFRRLLTGAEPSIATHLTLAELQHAQHEAEQLPISDAAVEELFKLRGEIAAEGITASDRRWRKAVRILRAAAWLEGSTEVTPESFPILANVLWETTEQIAKLTQTVSKYTSAELADAREAADAVLELVGTLPAKTSEQYGQQLVSVVREMKRAADRIGKLAKNCNGAQSKARIQAIHAEVEAKYKALRQDAAAALDL
jgi:MoxR-like ATPase